MSTAWAMKHLLRDVYTVNGVDVDVITMKMQQSLVQVSMNAIRMRGEAYAYAYVSKILGEKPPTGIVHLLMVHVVSEAKFLLL